MNDVDKHRFWLGTGLSISGVVIIIISLFIPPVGEVHPTALGAVGEIFLLAGCLLGLDSYVNIKMRKMFSQQEDKKEQKQ